MSRTRLTLVALLAVLVVGVVASASATEPPKKCGGKVTATPAYCVEGLQLENAKGEPIADKIEGTASVSVLKATIAMVTSEVECKKGQSKGTIKGGAAGTAGKSKIIETFEECKLLQPANCKLSPEDEKEIITAELVGTLELASGKIEDRFAPEGGFADIGIEGKKIKVNDRLVDAYYFCVGGSAGGNAAIARPVGYRCPATLVPESLERLLRGYLEDRYTSESLRTFLTRQSNDHLRALLAGEVTAAVERDQPAGRVPIGVGE